MPDVRQRHKLAPMTRTSCTFESLEIVALNNAGALALSAGDLHTALGAFALSGFLESTGSIRSDCAYQHAGAALWLAGERHVAAGLWRHAVQQLSKGRITHSDAAGGARSALLLWYAWRKTGEEVYANEAELHLLRLWRKPRSSMWPAPLGTFILGKDTAASVLAIAEDSGPLRSHHLAQAHFYVGLELQSTGEVEAALGHYRRAEEVAAPLEYRDIEFYLARYELAQARAA